jgi:hypothetical protein
LFKLAFTKSLTAFAIPASSIGVRFNQDNSVWQSDASLSWCFSHNNINTIWGLCWWRIFQRFSRAKQRYEGARSSLFETCISFCHSSHIDLDKVNVTSVRLRKGTTT